MQEPHAIIAEIIEFWFAVATAKRWFAGGADFDEEVRTRLVHWSERAAKGELQDWREMPVGCVALCVLLDQVPRNLFRGQSQALATDAAARAVTRHAVDHGFDLKLS